MTDNRTHSLRPYIHPSRSGGWRLAVWAQPGARRSEIVGMYQDCLKVRLAAPAVDNKANKALLAFVAKQLGWKTRQLRLETGHTSRKKVLAFEAGCNPDFTQLEIQA